MVDGLLELSLLWLSFLDGGGARQVYQPSW
jgi:hypothetical protein